MTVLRAASFSLEFKAPARFLTSNYSGAYKHGVKNFWPILGDKNRVIQAEKVNPIFVELGFELLIPQLEAWWNPQKDFFSWAFLFCLKHALSEKLRAGWRRFQIPKVHRVEKLDVHPSGLCMGFNNFLCQ